MLLNQYLPPYLTQTKTFTALINSEQIEINGIENSVQDIINQCFVNTATWGLDNWESFLGIVIDHSKDINYRRTVIKAKLRGTGTVTIGLIKLVADSFTNGNVNITESSGTYSFDIKFTSMKGIPPNLQDLKNSIEIIKPAHLAVTYSFSYDTNDMLKVYTHAQLSTHTYDQIKIL